MAVFVLLIASGFVLAESREQQAQVFQQKLLKATTRQETRPTQDPLLYANDPYIKEAYSIAKEIPDVLDKMFCYCYCALDHKHKSLLSCYVDDHSSKCGTCLREAVVAKQLTVQGKKPEEIAKIFADHYTAQQSRH